MTIDKQRSLAEELAEKYVPISHMECEDGWYSCELAENYLQPKSDQPECSCGAEYNYSQVVAAISEAIERCASVVDGYDFLDAGSDFAKPDLAARIRALREKA